MQFYASLRLPDDPIEQEKALLKLYEFAQEKETKGDWLVSESADNPLNGRRLKCENGAWLTGATVVITKAVRKFGGILRNQGF